jgi:hypothetical protein
VTVQDNLQSLITELERVLWEDKLTNHPDVSLLLERVRHYLLMSQCISDNDYTIQAEKLTEVVLNRLDTSMIHRVQPLQEELTQLHEQRQSLLAEIKVLEEQRQAMLSNFLEDLSKSFYDVLEQQSTTSEKSSLIETNSNIIELTSSLETVFKPLLQELQSYSDSLQEGISRMYSLGQQGETKFLAYFNRLQQHLEPSIQPSTSKNMPILDDSWYLGIDLTKSKFTVLLFTFKKIAMGLDGKNNLPGTFNYYSLSKLLNISTLDLSKTDSLLDSYKQQLINLNNVLNTAEQKNLKLEDIPLQSILDKVVGLILISPSRWNEGDRNLLKNILLETLTISQGKDLIFVPKPIALTLSYTPQNTSKTPSLSLLFNLTETMTELSLIDISQGISGIINQRFAYGTKGMDEDILCQLIYPQWYEQITATIVPLSQPFPNPGMADLLTRESLNKQLENYPLGKVLLEASQLTRLILQQKEAFSSTIMQKSWSVNRQEMGENVIKPWIEQINNKLTLLLSQGKYSPNSITQIIVSGEAISSVNYGLFPWLTERLPDAILIQAEDDKKDEIIFQGLGYLLNNNSSDKLVIGKAL